MKEKCKKPPKNNNNKEQAKAEMSKGNRSYNNERMRAKWFCCAFKLGFCQSICKASLIFKLNFELAVSIILKQRELYESKHVSEECRCIQKCFPNIYLSIRDIFQNRPQIFDVIWIKTSKCAKNLK